MHSTAFSTVRTAIVVLFVLAPPLIAIPSVSAWLDVWWSRRAEATSMADVEVDQSWTALSPVERAINPISDQYAPNLRAVGSQEADPPSPSSRSQPDANQWTAVYRQLHDLGAISSSLISTEDGGPRFRFRCLIPVSDSVYTRSFEHASDDPRIAMRRVLAEVQSWRSARDPAELTSTKVR